MKRLWTGVPQAGVRWTRALACCMGGVLLAAAAVPVANDGAVVSLSVVPTTSQAQVVIGIDGAVSVNDFTLTGPDRIVVDITGARLGVRSGGYDKLVRGGVLDVRYSQNQPNVVRVVLTVAGPRRYEVSREAANIRISVDGGGTFSAWRIGKVNPALAEVPRARRTEPTPRAEPTSKAVVSYGTWKPLGTARPSESPTAPSRVTVVSAGGVQEVMAAPIVRSPQQQPRITIAWENANIADVLAAFAAFSGRTIIPAKNVTGNVTAEIIDKPWDVAMRAILNANGFDAIEDENGIIIVNTIEALAARPRFEQLTTRTVRFNYTSANAVAAALAQRLTRDCGTLTASGAPSGPVAVPVVTGVGGANCPLRGAVTADTLTNSVSITESPSVIEDMIQYARTLDVRQPQVNIKAKIILVDRTQLEALGLRYDLGSANQSFTDLVVRPDSTGAPQENTTIFLGGNAISMIANSATAVPNAALRVIYSAAIGGFDFTTFLDAMSETSLLDVQAEPSVTTLNYRTAVLSAGTQVPVRTIEPGTGGNAGGAFPQVTVQMRQTGIVLNVTPYITNNRQIQMKVLAENSDVQFQGGDIGAVFPTQRLENELLVADGETAVMGGLTQTSVRISKTGIPILMDLPLLGRLFGVTNRSETKRDLLILITPHIVDEGDMTMEPRRSP